MKLCNYMNNNMLQKRAFWLLIQAVLQANIGRLAV